MKITEVDTKEELYKATREFNTPSIYVLKCNEYYKIGRSLSIMNRINTLQIGNPYIIELIFFARTDKDLELERKIHDKFAHKRKRGEWFELSNNDLVALEDFIKDTWTTDANIKANKSSRIDS